jgi:hypothetical protein
MTLRRPPLSVRVLVIGALVVVSIATLVLLARYGLHRLAVRQRNGPS